MKDDENKKENKDLFKNARKLHIKNYKNNDCDDEVFLSRIEEYIVRNADNNKLKERLLETCLPKDLKTLFVDKKEGNDKNNILGYSIDNQNKTIIRFNKSPNKLKIEKFIFPEGTKKKRYEDTVNKINSNTNIIVRKEHTNIPKKIKYTYSSDIEDEKKKKDKKVQSNIIISKDKIKKEIRESKHKNTVLEKPSNINNLLKVEPKEKPKNKKNEKEKEKEGVRNQRGKLKTKKEERRKTKERDFLMRREDNETKKDEYKKTKDTNIESSINPSLKLLRSKKKSKTKKQGKTSFELCNGNEKRMSRKHTQNNFLIKNNNIKENEGTDKRGSNLNQENEEHIIDIKKNRMLSNKSNNTKSKNRGSFKKSHVAGYERQKSKKNNKKLIQFQSLLSPKKTSLFDQKQKDF